MSESICILREVLEELKTAAKREPGLECCGLLAGRKATISLALPAINALQSSHAFEIAPAELFGLFRTMRAKGLDHLGIYHSHPRGENTPSPQDIAAAFYPQAAYFILSPLTDAPRPVRAFRMVDGKVRELTLQIL